MLKDGDKYNKQPDGTYDYVDGSGKRHQGTNYSDTFLEWGELPHEHQGKSKDVEKILALLKDGADNLEIVDQVPSAMLNIDKVERTRSMYRDKQFAETYPFQFECALSTVTRPASVPLLIILLYARAYTLVKKNIAPGAYIVIKI